MSADILAREASRNSERKRCRNLRCRTKLPVPVENHRRAFCCRGCFESFYLNRCRVCEADLRKQGRRGDAGRLYCRPPKDCRQEAQKWPEKYAYGLRAAFPTTNVSRRLGRSSTAFAARRASRRSTRRGMARG
jgi:hypothetical protein